MNLAGDIILRNLMTLPIHILYLASIIKNNPKSSSMAGEVSRLRCLMESDFRS